jgi:hypothetical protein
MSYPLSDTGKPVTLHASFLDDAAPPQEVPGTVTFGSTGPIVITAHSETRTVTFAPGAGLGDATVTATLTDEDGETTEAVPWNITVHAGDATTGAFSVVDDPNAPPPTPVA